MTAPIEITETGSGAEIACSTGTAGPVSGNSTHQTKEAELIPLLKTKGSRNVAELSKIWVGSSTQPGRH